MPSGCRAGSPTPAAHFEIGSRTVNAPTLGWRDTLEATEDEARVALAGLHAVVWAGLVRESRMAGVRAWISTQGVRAIGGTDQGCGGRSSGKETDETEGEKGRMCLEVPS